MFSHEKLDVYRAALELNAWVGALLDGPLLGCRLNVVKQLDSAATSVPLNIAEGNGKRSRRDQCRFLDIARGSALESAACLDTLVTRRVLTREQTTEGKKVLERIVKMLVKMTMRILARGEAEVIARPFDDDNDDDNDNERDHDYEHDYDHGVDRA